MFLNTRSTSALANFVKTLHHRNKIASSCVSRIQELNSEDTSGDTNFLSSKTGFTEEQQILILQKINTCTVDELTKYRITKVDSKRLTAHRDRYGYFKNLTDVLLMQGIDINNLRKFCKSIVMGGSVQKVKSIAWLIPALPPDVTIGMNTMTGISVAGRGISWAQVDRDCNLLHWDFETFPSLTPKDGLVQMVKAVATIVSKIPVSHAYIMESEVPVTYSRLNSISYSMCLNRQQVASAMISLLGTREPRFGGDRESHNHINNIYLMRPRTPARLFKLLIGSEEVSAKSIVEKIIDVDYDDPIININANVELRETYTSRNDYERNQMNGSLLLIATFVKLALPNAPRL